MLHTLHTGKAWRHFVNRRYGETLAAARVSLAREKIYRFALAGSRDFSKNRENSDLNRAEGGFSRWPLFLFQTYNRRNNSPGERGKVKTMLQVITFQTATLRLKNSIHRSPLRRVFFLIPVALALFAFVPASRAVSPAPDGGYANGNTAEGSFALQSLTIGVNNTALGFGALFHNTSGGSNSATGAGALFSNTIGIQNTANGVGALFSNTTVGVNSGHDNTATGFEALASNTTGINNTATGSQALASNTTGSFNTAVGAQALVSNAGAGSNTAVGFSALANSSGAGNIALGAGAGLAVQAGTNNIDIGNAGADESATIRIGLPTGTGHQTATFIAGISGESAVGGDAVFVTSSGKLGTITAISSERFKDEIKPMDNTSEAILALKPVTFRYKKELDPKRIPQFGLVAEEVEKVNPDLVKRDRDGNLQTVRYDAVNAMLLNEFLKEHQK